MGVSLQREQKATSFIVRDNHGVPEDGAIGIYASPDVVAHVEEIVVVVAPPEASNTGRLLVLGAAMASGYRGGFIDRARVEILPAHGIAQARDGAWRAGSRLATLGPVAEFAIAAIRVGHALRLRRRCGSRIDHVARAAFAAARGSDDAETEGAKKLVAT